MTNRSRALAFFLPPLVLFSAIAAYHLQAIPSPDPVYKAIRAAGMMAYPASFLAIVTSAFPKEATSLSGESFLRVHHIFAFWGLTLMLVHAGATWASFGTPAVLVPQVGTLREFFLFGGRAALPLFILTAATAKFGRSIKFWRKIHLLNYAAFILVTIHAVMIGTDFDSPPMRALAYMFAAVVLAVPIIRFFRKKP
ncbi:MAG: hypothetical protein RQ767_07515 [Thermovirgaceae bacterium]|nr:hypothetical protein [Thermovirgaceae bacterium]